MAAISHHDDGDSEHYRSCWRSLSVRHDDDIVVKVDITSGSEWFVKHQRFFSLSLFSFFSLFSVGARQFWVSSWFLTWITYAVRMVGHD